MRQGALAEKFRDIPWSVKLFAGRAVVIHAADDDILGDVPVTNSKFAVVIYGYLSEFHRRQVD